MRSTNQRNPKTFVSHSSNLSKAQRLESPKQPAFYKRFLSTMSRKHQVLTQRENATHNNHNGDLQPTLTKPKLSQRKQRHRKVVKSTANELVNGKDKVSGFGQWWGYMTGALVDAATVPFLFLLLPQIIKNFRNLVAGQATELMVLSWMSYLTALLGNTLLLSYFVAKQEIGASIIQVIGVASNMVILSQLYVAGLMPGQVFWSVALLQSVMAVISMAKVTGHISNDINSLSYKIYSWWQTALGMVGLAVLPQVLATTLFSINSIVPGVVSASAAVALMIMDKSGSLPDNMATLWSTISAWTATALFCCSPVVQLIRNFSDTSSLSGLSKLTILLAMSGNGLMIPRALFIGDFPWIVGSTWGCFLMGWGQLLSLFMGQYLQKYQFFGLTMGLMSYVIVVLWGNRKAKINQQLI
eukprot:TRINITY_DN1768_c1_g1_i11.p1 TRINITY_DN1768_c1_g1~~TRINITY_DN1768_c1_g1_i11.p1  ORF type:complete len:413 (-),score=30.29 TRINITY_DN1768_c1_g1_i11:207-1445(-)